MLIQWRAGIERKCINARYGLMHSRGESSMPREIVIRGLYEK